MPARECYLLVENALGLHARASAKIVNLASQFDDRTEIFLSCEGVEVNAKSILGLMMFAAAKGTTLKARAQGPQAGAAITALQGLFQRKFDEE